MRHRKFRHFDKFDEKMIREHEKNQFRGRVIGGILAIGFGVLLLLHQLNMGVHQAFASWQFALVLVGVGSLLKHKFQKFFGFVPLAIGAVFMAKEFYPGLIETKLIWPVLIIVFGIGIFIKAFSRKKNSCYRRMSDEELAEVQGDDYFESTAFFGGVSKKVVSKNFKGANISSIFGGTELDLSNADFEKEAGIAIHCVFGGVNIIVPSHWKVKSDINTAFGGVDDRRSISLVDENGKLLVLTGSCTFGGVEISGHA
ncbi:MAG: LiaF transmembrane domain-containing protein [Bacteroidota bacterium]